MSNKKINITTQHLTQAAQDTFFKKALAAIVICKLSFGSSTIHNFSLNRFRKILHCDYTTANSLLSYLKEEGYVKMSRKKDGTEMLTFVPLSNFTKQKYSNTVSFILKEEMNEKTIVLSLDEKTTTKSNSITLHTVEALIEDAILVRQLFILASKSNRLSRKKARNTKCSDKAVLLEKFKKEMSKQTRKFYSESDLLTIFRAVGQDTYNPLTDLPELRKKIHKTFDGTKGYEFSMYAKYSITLEQIVSKVFYGTISLSTVKRRLQSLKARGVLNAVHHGRTVVETWNERNKDGLKIREAYKNALGDSCYAFISKRQKFLYNRNEKNQKAISEDSGNAAATVWFQPWANTYEFNVGGIMSRTKLKRQKRGGIMA